MFDARSLLEQLMRSGGSGPSRSEAPAGGLGGLGDILGQLGQAMGQQGGQPAGRAPSPAEGLPGGLGEILGKLGEAMGQPQGRQIAPDARQQPMPSGSEAGGAGGLEEILKSVLPGGSGAGARGGGLMDILGQVLGQATQGVREGAGRVDDATGASGHVRDAIGRATGKSPDELLAQLKDLIEKNQLGAGAIAGGLGGLLLGTRSGRSMAATAVKIGGLALIGGLAYKALQNYQQGRPVIGETATGTTSALVEAPQGSGFEASAVSNAAALLYIRAMIAAAAADGRVDANEQQRIVGGLKQAGLDAEAEEFLAQELNNPASVADLAGSVSNEAEAVQLFTAARVAIDLDSAGEHEFLVSLADALGLDRNLAAYVDAEARAAA
ncbi:MAG: DUF533 domain-containing protein [Hyphomicrobiaceae bacterium]|nr:DUF533 domain-containing protein [Hyphomicrobiaceae bacterium]